MKHWAAISVVLLVMISVGVLASAQSTQASSHNKPNPPINVVASPGYQHVRVSWEDSSTSSISQWYVVTASPGGQSTTTQWSRSAFIPGLTNGVDYTFTVVARNGDGDSAPSAPSAAVAPSEKAMRPVALRPDGTLLRTFGAKPHLNFDGSVAVFETTHTLPGTIETDTALIVYTVDIASGAITLVSNMVNKGQGWIYARNSTISADGRYVAFDSKIRDEAGEDTNSAEDIFLYDRDSDALELVSRSSDGELGDSGSYSPFLTADSRYVFFNSASSNLTPGDTNEKLDGFVRDVQSGLTTQLALSPSGEQWFENSSILDISNDGRFVLYRSITTVLPGEDSSLAGGIFVLDRQNLSLRRVGLDESGAKLGTIHSGTISGDGYVVTYLSPAPTGITYGDVYRHDLKTNVVTRLDLSSNRVIDNHPIPYPKQNDNGRYVVFMSDYALLLPDHVPDTTSVYVHDWVTGQTARVAIVGTNVQGAYSNQPDISGDGRWIIFKGPSTLFPGGDVYADDVYIVTNPLKAEGSPVPPDPPTNVVADEFDGLVDLDWAPPADDGGLPIDFYTITSLPDGFIATTTATSISTSVLGVGNNYTFKVKATNAEGTGMWSADSNAIAVLTKPDAPTNVTASAGIEQASVSWTAPPDDDGAPLLSYTVISSPDGLTSTPTATSTVITGLTNGTTYTFTVIATNAVGDSTSSLPSNQVTPSLTVPSAPELVNLSAGNATVTVTWTPPTDSGTSPVASYDVSLHLAGATGTTVAIATKTASDSSHTFSGLANGVRYIASISASNSTGAGPADWSPSGRTSAIPTAALVTFTDADSTVLNPGDTTATLEVSIAESPLSADGIQIGLLHGSDIVVSNPTCTGLFNGGSTIGPITTSSGSVVSCFLLSSTASTSTGAVMTFNVTHLGSGTSSRIRISDQSSSGTTLSSGGVEELITAGGTANIAWESGVIVGPDIMGTMSLQATGVERIPVIVRVESNGFFAAAYVADDGTYRVGGVPAGEHTVTITAAGFLPARFSGVYVDDYGIDLPPVQLRAGLVNGDSVVSILDISAVAARFLKTHPLRTDPLGRIVDLNADGIVNILDISMVASNFGRGGLQVW
ncbi:MAG: fibronectin type III domain-containing protein [Chloroflexi bacterium]|nr:fibronectin type III domain-containing protein [Chloroflexota bacterium]